MCATSSLTLTAPKTKAARLCWWACDRREARELIEASIPAPCAAEERGVTTYYRLARHPYQAGTWQLYKEMPDASEPLVYTIRCGEAADALDFTCDHNHVCGFSGKVAVGCRHCCLVAALLKAIGLVP